MLLQFEGESNSDYRRRVDKVRIIGLGKIIHDAIRADQSIGWTGIVGFARDKVDPDTFNRIKVYLGNDEEYTISVFKSQEKVPMISTWEGRLFNQLLPDERVKAFDFLTAEHKAGRIDFRKMVELHQELRDAQATSVCPQASDAKHDFSSQGCPAGVQACIHCGEVEL